MKKIRFIYSSIKNRQFQFKNAYARILVRATINLAFLQVIPKITRMQQP